MNCDEASAKLESLFDGLLDSSSADEMRSHISVCEKCSTEWRELDELRRLLHKSVVVVPSESLDQRTLAVFDEKWREKRRRFGVVAPWWKRRITIPIPAFALSIVLLVGLSWFLVARTNDSGRLVKPINTVEVGTGNQQQAANSQTNSLSRFDHGGRAVIYVEKHSGAAE